MNPGETLILAGLENLVDAAERNGETKQEADLRAVLAAVRQAGVEGVLMAIRDASGYAADPDFHVAAVTSHTKSARRGLRHASQGIGEAIESLAEIPA